MISGGFRIWHWGGLYINGSASFFSFHCPFISFACLWTSFLNEINWLIDWLIKASQGRISWICGQWRRQLFYKEQGLSFYDGASRPALPGPALPSPWTGVQGKFGLVFYFILGEFLMQEMWLQQFSPHSLYIIWPDFPDRVDFTWSVARPCNPC